jgi:hypothetical protein
MDLGAAHELQPRLEYPATATRLVSIPLTVAQREAIVSNLQRLERDGGLYAPSAEAWRPSRRDANAFNCVTFVARMVEGTGVALPVGYPSDGHMGSMAAVLQPISDPYLPARIAGHRLRQRQRVRPVRFPPAGRHW